MKKTKFSEQQIAFIPRQAEEGASAHELLSRNRCTTMSWRRR
jgi:hypothetical protein